MTSDTYPQIGKTYFQDGKFPLTVNHIEEKEIPVKEFPDGSIYGGGKAIWVSENRIGWFGWFGGKEWSDSKER